MGFTSWVIGFGTFLAVAVAARFGLEFLLDTWWASDGLDPASRPPLNAGAEWMVSGLMGIGAGWLVIRVLGED